MSPSPHPGAEDRIAPLVRLIAATFTPMRENGDLDLDRIPPLVDQLVHEGIDGLFVETHPTPDKALSDAATMWPLAAMGSLVRQVRAVDDVLKSGVGAGSRR